MIEWVSLFYNRLKKKNPEYVLIWYDSINEDGNLIYYNSLNKKNLVWEQTSDYFFTNYDWNYSSLIESAKLEENKAKILFSIDMF